MARPREETRRYAEDFKLKVIEEIESGKISRAEASRLYGINHGTLWDWIQLYGRVSKPRRVEVVMSDQKEKIEELQKALAEAHLKARFYEELVKIAKDKHGLDLKKNTGTPSAKPSKKKAKASRRSAGRSR